ncbi:hypothetical protein GCM10023147_02000 [Tsukamurella soli]|uniref:Uncharacterized protein n=1 Tax=Tsukamurella soli TaxID=644556 RepID=A0ABP8J1D7_9ACTN
MPTACSGGSRDLRRSEKQLPLESDTVSMLDEAAGRPLDPTDAESKAMLPAHPVTSRPLDVR